MGIVKLFLVLLQIFLQVVKSAVLPSIIWDPRNKIFHKKANCNDEYAHISIDLSSELYFICPSIALTSSVLQSAISKKMLYENMYIVNKEEFENCQIDKLTDTTKRFLTCDSPMNPQTIKYRRTFISIFGPSNRILHTVGQTYYFIATSNGTQSGLNRIKGGRCKTHNMRLAITICNAGENCFVESLKCLNPVKPEETTTTTTTTTTKKPGIKETDVVSNNGPDVSARKTDNPKDDSGHDSATLVYGIIGGMICGLLLGAAVAITATRYFQKRSYHYDNKNKNEMQQTSALVNKQQPINS